MESAYSKLILSFAATIAGLRLFIGVDISDESQYVGQTVLPLIGGRPFVNDLLIQQAAQWFILLPCWVYSRVFGFNGIVLFVRVLYWGLALANLIIWHHVLWNYRRKIETTLVSTSFVLFVPFSIPSWSYNTVAQITVPLALLFLFRTPSLSSPTLQPILGGILAAVACFAYPPVCLVFAYAGFSAFRSFRTERTCLIKAALSCSCAVVMLGSILLLIIGLGELENALLFSAQFGEGGGLEKILMMIYDAFKALSVGHVVIIACIIALIIQDRPLEHRSILLFLVLVLLGSFAANSLTLHKVHGWIFFSTIALVLLRPVLRSRGLLPELPAHLALIARCSLLTGTVFGYSSGNGVMNCAIGFIPALCIYLLQLFTAVDDFGLKDGITRSWILATSTLTMAYLSWSSFAYIYRDNPILATATLVRSGPFRGILTTPERAKLVEQLHADIVDLARTRGSIFAAHMTPAYFSASLTPVTRMLYIHPITWPSDRFRQIVEPIEHGQLPEIVVIGDLPRIGMPQQFDDYFSSSGRYRLYVKREGYTIRTLTP